MKVSVRFKDLAGIAVSVLLLVLVIRNLHMELFWASFHQLKAGAFLLCLLIHMLQTFLLGWRWSLLIKSAAERQPYSAIASYWLGNFFNNLLPGRIGDLLKVRYLTFTYKVSYQNGIAALIAEKFLDVQVMVFFALLSGYLLPVNFPLINWVTAGLAVGVIAADAVLLFLVIKRPLLKKTLGLLPAAKVRAWLYGLFLLFNAKLQHLIRVKKMGLFLTGSAGIYCIGVLCYFLIMTASGLGDLFTDFTTCLAFPVFFMVIHFIPSAPSGVGVVHYGIYKALLIIAAAKGITITPALENQIIFSTLLFHFLYFVPETIIGLIYLVKERQVLFATSALS